MSKKPVLEGVGKKKKKSGHETFRRQKDEVPYIVDACLTYLEKNAIDAEGLFRVSGAVLEVNEIRKQFDKGKKVDFTKVRDHNVVAGVLKSWLRDLSDPLLTYELYECFVAVNKIPDPDARVGCIARIVDYLPIGNRATLKRLIAFLKKVEMQSEKNRMNASNLAIVFAPNLLRPPGEDIHKALHDSQATNDLLRLLIHHYEQIFLKQGLVNPSDVMKKLSEQQKAEVMSTLRRGTIKLALTQTEQMMKPPPQHQHHHEAPPSAASVFANQPGAGNASASPPITDSPVSGSPASPKQQMRAVKPSNYGNKVPAHVMLSGGIGQRDLKNLVKGSSVEQLLSVKAHPETATSAQQPEIVVSGSPDTPVSPRSRPLQTPSPPPMSEMASSTSSTTGVSSSTAQPLSSSARVVRTAEPEKGERRLSASIGHNPVGRRLSVDEAQSAAAAAAAAAAVASASTTSSSSPSSAIVASGAAASPTSLSTLSTSTQKAPESTSAMAFISPRTPIPAPLSAKPVPAMKPVANVPPSMIHHGGHTGQVAAAKDLVGAAVAKGMHPPPGGSRRAAAPAPAAPMATASPPASGVSRPPGAPPPLLAGVSSEGSGLLGVMSAKPSGPAINLVLPVSPRAPVPSTYQPNAAIVPPPSIKPPAGLRIPAKPKTAPPEPPSAGGPPLATSPQTPSSLSSPTGSRVSGGGLAAIPAVSPSGSASTSPRAEVASEPHSVGNVSVGADEDENSAADSSAENSDEEDGDDSGTDEPPSPSPSVLLRPQSSLNQPAAAPVVSKPKPSRPPPAPPKREDLTLDQLINMMMEGQTDDVMLHLMTYPEKDRIAMNNMIREGLAKKLEEFDK